MNPIDILGDLLGHKSTQPGRGGDVLKDIFRRGSEKQSSNPPTKPSPEVHSHQIDRQAKALEEFLNVANDRSSRRKTGSTRSTFSRQSPSQTRQQPSPSRQTASDRYQAPDETRAVVMIRAMVNAAKADGRIDQTEQNNILNRLGDASDEGISFLRKEFSAPLDVEEFVRAVPFGLEEQVYTMSLIAIDLNERSEANYLRRLADGLRIPLDVRKQIHQRLGAPNIV